MTINDQTNQFLFELQTVVNRFVNEYDLNHATIVGCIEMLKMDYLIEGGEEIVFESDQDLLDQIDDEDAEELPF